MNADSAHQTPAPGPSARSTKATTEVIASAALVLAVPLVVVSCLVLAVVPWIPWFVGIPVGLVVAAVIVARRVRRAADILLAGLGAVPADSGDHARFHNLVQGLSLAGGVPEPELYIVHDDARNAAAVVQGDRSAIVASTGLLQALDRISLEGVVAESLVRIRSGDAEASTLGAALFGGLLLGPVAAVVRPAAAFGLRRLLPADRDLVADRAAVTLTRYPPGLLAALTTIRSGSARARVATMANEHVWLVPPATVGEARDVVVSGAPLDLRIDVLAEL